MAEASPASGHSVSSSVAVAAATPSSKPGVLISGNLVYAHPDEIKDWTEGMLDWPELKGQDIVYYLVHSKACDHQEVRCYKSLESYNYLQSGWVGEVLLHKVNEDIVLLKEDVTPSQALKNKPHRVWVSAKKEGEALNAGCTCMAGQARVCSHVSAVLWKVDCAVSRGLSGKTCTDEIEKWNKDTTRNVQPSEIEGINFRLQRRTVDPTIQRPARNVQVPLSQAEIKRLHEDSRYPELFNIPGMVLQATFTAALRQAAPISEDQDSLQHCAHDDINALPESCGRCSNFYSKFIVLSPRAAASLEENTRQHNSQLWKDAGLLGLTASGVKRVPKKSTTPCKTAVQAMLLPRFFGNSATKHGHKYEPVACEQFPKRAGLSVTHSGTVLHAAVPWLSASPDGVLQAADALLEVKCPYVMDAVDLIRKGKYDLKEVGDKYILAENGPNGYYG
ncbi:uncharacterized protein LOC144094696 [Amblyomma americanum]